MIKRDVLFSIFDKKKGAIPIYFSGTINQQEAQNVAFRSQMTLSMMSTTELETAEAILPFTSINKIGFILLFNIQSSDPTEPKCVASLSYLVPQDHQVFLYNKFAFLKYKAEELANLIQQNYVYSENSYTNFPEVLKNQITDWQVSEKEASAEIEIVEKKVTLSEKKEGGSVEFFLSQVKKNEDRALGALYRGKSVIVTGESNVIIDLIVHSLDLFVPHASLRKVGFTQTIVDPSYAEIIGVSKKLVENYPNLTLIDLDKKQVKNGESCRYSKEVIKQLRKNPTKINEIIKESTNKILKVASLLIDVFSYPEEEQEKRISEIQKIYDSNLIEVAAEVAAQRNPLISELLLQKVSNRFLDWMGEL